MPKFFESFRRRNYRNVDPALLERKRQLKSEINSINSELKSMNINNSYADYSYMLMMAIPNPFFLPIAFGAQITPHQQPPVVMERQNNLFTNLRGLERQLEQVKQQINQQQLAGDTEHGVVSSNNSDSLSF